MTTMGRRQFMASAVAEAFKAVRQYFKFFDNTNYINGLPNKDVCVPMSWSGDYATAAARGKEKGVNVNLRYDVPMSGSPIWFDLFVIPSDSKNVDAAHAFLKLPKPASDEYERARTRAWNKIRTGS